MTMTIPTIPSMPAGYITTAADFNNLAYAAQFLLTKPVARIHDTAGTQALATSPASITFGTADFDTDGMWNVASPTVLTVQTAGFYRVDYAVSGFQSTGNTISINAYVLITTGSNNPAGAGLTSQAWMGGGAGGAPSGQRTYARSGGVIPWYMYAGDTAGVQVYAAATGPTLSTGFSPSFLALEYVSI